MALLLGGPSFAASFPCEKTQSPVERMICADAELSELDEALANAYETAMQNPSIKKSLQAQQRAWLQVVRNRDANPFHLKKVYRERIEQLTSKTPLVAAPSGSFGCEVDISSSDEDESETRNLSLQMQNGRLTQFIWRAILIPKSSDLRPGFHYRTDMSLSDMNIIEVPGYLALQSKPIAGLANRLQENCDVILTKNGSKLHAYTVGCESRPDTSHFDYKFDQSGSDCRLENSER